jgi:V-type H+-transporting ATPase subunit a
MNILGEIGFSQFIDLNKDEAPHTLPFTNQVKQCEEAERKLAYLQDQCKRHYVPITPPENIDGFLQHLNKIKDTKRKAIHLLLDEIMREIKSHEKFIQEQNARLKESEATLESVKNFHQVLRVAHRMIPQFNQQMMSDIEGRGNQKQSSVYEPLIQNDLINIERVAGVIDSEEIFRFRKLIFRVTKGKSYIYTEQYVDPENPEGKARSVYIITYYDGIHIREKIRRICDSFSGQRFDIPEHKLLQARIQEMSENIRNQRSVYDSTKQQLRQQLIDFDSVSQDGIQKSSSTIFIYKMFLAQEKALYQSLNTMKAYSGGLIGYFWAPAEQETEIMNKLASHSASKVSPIKDNFHIEPPTYNKMTEFSFVFQQIVDTYGIPTYQEANPTPVSIVTFPFMFGLMFGDMGHGSILAFFGLFLTLGANHLQKSSLKMLLPYRYFFLLLGMCSTYCGFMYNEFFAMPTELFSSCYDLNAKKQWSLAKDVTAKTGNWYYDRKDFKCTYPMGVDPVWGLSNQKLTFANNIKMKLSVIMGIVHMTIGVMMKGTNALFRHDLVTFLFEVVTGLIMLLGMFGWMDLLIYGKWFFPIQFVSRDIITVDNKPEFLGDVVNRHTPSVINIMITTVFGGGQLPDGTHDYSFLVSGDRTKYPPDDAMQAAMYSTSVNLLIWAVSCVPLMLLVKPCCCRPKHHHEPEKVDEEYELTRILPEEERNFSINNGNAMDNLVESRKK